MRKSLRDTLLENNKADRFLALMAGKEPRAQSVISEKRVYTKRTDTGPTEAQVLKAIRDAVRAHPKVAFCWRQQSGVFRDGDRTITVGFRGMPDLIGMLRGSGRWFAIEVKRDKHILPTPEQAEILQWIRGAGGIAGVCASVDDALDLIKQS